MRIKLITWLLLLLLRGQCYAQQKQQVPRVSQFRSINTIGLVDGQSGGALQILTINGVQHKTWFFGIGTGADGYRLRSIPLFADVRKTISGKIFAYTDAGVNWYWHRDGDIKQFYSNDKFKAGFYGEAGAGYSVKLHKRVALLFSGGYRFKKLTEKGDEWDTLGFPHPATSPSKINYSLHSVVIKVGMSF